MAPVDLTSLLALAVRAAEEAGALLRAEVGRVRTSVTTKTSPTDMVSEVDRAAEELVLAHLVAARPDDAVVGEEGSDRTGRSGVTWYVDPLDGTTNYLYGLPAYAVSIGAEVDGALAVGVVHDAARGETFAAATGLGATLDGRPIRCSSAGDLATALVGTGFSYDADRRREQAAVLAALLPRVRDVRRGGAAAIDLCAVACGRLDAHYERGLQPWDVAAGAVIASEAGAWVGTPDGGPLVLAGRGGPPGIDAVVAAPGIAAALRASVAGEPG